MVDPARGGNTWLHPGEWLAGGYTALLEVSAAHLLRSPALPQKKPTIDDVAAHAGVARTTVSRVLNGGPHVSAGVRERVQRAVAALDYKVNAQARFLAGGGSRQLMLVHVSAFDAEPNSYYHSGLELGALRACSELGFTLSTHALDPTDPDHAKRLIALVKSARVEGLVLTPPLSDDVALVQAIMRLDCPVVCISGGPEARSLTASIGIDDEAAGYAMGQLLIGLGHRKFGYIDGPEGHVSAGQRLDGVRRAMGEAGLPKSHIRVERGDFTFRSGVVVCETILAAHPDFTALICANDDMAAGAMHTIHRMGLTIPGDLSVSGFDDTPVSGIVWPPLTTVHQPIRRLGQRAVITLVNTIQSPPLTTVHETVPFQIVERASTGKPRDRRSPFPLP
ncbi:MAG: LacI family transcriptional regulator [Caulobacteraceae bacterium]|nr:MAG: LacI family transcriptional regulator [Caulobacteraceae bacterium]